MKIQVGGETRRSPRSSGELPLSYRNEADRVFRSEVPDGQEPNRRPKSQGNAFFGSVTSSFSPTGGLRSADQNWWRKVRGFGGNSPDQTQISKGQKCIGAIAPLIECLGVLD